MVLFQVVAAPRSAAETYPNRPIHIVVPGSAGSVLDLIARRISEKISQSMGQPVVIDNKPGANGFIAAEAVARSKPDGYTLLHAYTSLLCVNPALFGKLPYDPIRDFAPVTLVARGSPILMVNPKLPVKTLAEFVAYAKARPGGLTYGSPAVGSTQHIAVKLLEQLTGIEMTHVPYKNQPQILSDLMGGQIDAAVDFATVSVPHIKAGNVRALAIVGSHRKPVLPETPTAAEAGVPGFEVTSWNGFMVPAGTSPEVVARLNKEIVAAMKDPGFIDWTGNLGGEAVPMTPAEFGTYIKDELGRWTKIIVTAKMQAE
jgi:tripartite-type tricarboxylate transporter receptor subunit TctC